MDNCTLEDTSNMAYSVVYGCVFVLGFPLNAVSLWIMFCRLTVKSPSVVFMINLAISDILLVISLPMRVYFYATGSWPLGIMACTWITMLFRNNIRSSAIFITFISVDRLLAVVYPLRSGHLRTTTNARRACYLAWVFIVATSIPESIAFHMKTENYNTCSNKTSCFEFPDNLSSLKQTSLMVLRYFMTSALLIILAVNVVSTAMVYWTLRRHLKDSARINSKMNVMLIFVMNLLMFVIFFLPLNLVLLFNLRAAIKPTLCLCSFNCCLDPLLYYFSLDAFWKKQENVDNRLTREQLATLGEEDVHRVQGNS